MTISMRLVADMVKNNEIHNLNDLGFLLTVLRDNSLSDVVSDKLTNILDSHFKHEE